MEKILNEPATKWLKSEIPNKSKWAQAFDAGGCRYGIMTTNISEVFNNVLKGIRAMPVSAIVEYTFHKCNYYFVDRWKRARAGIDAGEVWGKAIAKHLTSQGEISATQEAQLFDPRSYVYSVRSAFRTCVGGEGSGSRIYRVDLTTVQCT